MLTTMETRKCSNCSRAPQPLEEFVSAKKPGAFVKTCRKCRAKDDKQKSKPDVREKANVRNREKKYYADYREKQRAADETGFLARNAAQMNAWRAKNPEYQSRLQKEVLSVRVSIVKSSARCRRLAMELDDAAISALVAGACAYCGVESRPGAFNGVDRVDSTIGYVSSNVVSCCGTCNFSKGSLDPATFVRRCAHIAGAEDHADAWPVGGSHVAVGQYKERAAKRGLEFSLGIEEFEAMRRGACRYCARAPEKGDTFGVDRLDSAAGYVPGNCATACSECNYMKRWFSESDFRATCAAVAARRGEPGPWHEFAGEPCLRSITKRVT